MKDTVISITEKYRNQINESMIDETQNIFFSLQETHLTFEDSSHFKVKGLLLSK